MLREFLEEEIQRMLREEVEDRPDGVEEEL